MVCGNANADFWSWRYSGSILALRIFATNVLRIVYKCFTNNCVKRLSDKCFTNRFTNILQMCLHNNCSTHVLQMCLHNLRTIVFRIFETAVITAGKPHNFHEIF